jgi:hypothetical protein
MAIGENTSYENVLSGSFIYSLGLLDGKMSPDHPITNSINFLQQTPDDKRIGDLLASWNDRLFIIEFKRSVAHLKDELKKESKQHLPALFHKNKNMVDISERCHFIGFGLYDKIQIGTENKSKIELVFQKYHSLITETPDEITPLNSFLQKVRNDKNYGLSSKEKFQTYLEFLLKNCSLTEPSSSSPDKRVTKPISGIVTSISDKGEITFIQYRSYYELSQLMEMKIELSLQLQNQLKHQQLIERAIQAKKKIRRSQNRGMGM